MKFIVVPILILLLAAQTFSGWVTILNFKSNQAYIAAKLCQNRNRPQLHCNGNCVLMRKMREHEKQEQNVPGPVKIEITTVVLSSRTYFTGAIASLSVTNKVYGPLVDSGKPVDRPVPIFHPPTA